MIKTLTRTFVLTSIFALLAGISFGQQVAFSKPRKEKLLNDLTVLIWKQPAEKVSISLRIHSGSAFDPMDKEGTTQLLTDVLFPDTGIYEDFAGELGGSLNVSSGFDYIQIDIIAANDKLISALDILASTISNPVISKEATEAAKKFRLEKIAADNEDPKLMADFEVRERLYGVFPYGRSSTGTEESLANVDFADLIFAKQRFLTSDNATISITGDIDANLAYRATRRFFGGWQKGSGKVPPNFSLPEKPETTSLTVNTDTGVGIEERFAVESASRTSNDYFAAAILARIFENRLAGGRGGNFEYVANYLRGHFMIGRTILPIPANSTSNTDSEKQETKISSPFSMLFSVPVTDAEFKSAKEAEISHFKSETISNLWFDIETYNLKSVEDELSKLGKVSLTDVNTLVSKLAKNPVVAVDLLPLDAADPLNDGDPNDPR